MKKVLSVLVSVLIVWAVLPLTASAIATPLEGGSTMASAAEIPDFGVEYVSSLDKAGEVDWFKFTAIEDTHYTIVFENYNIYTVTPTFDAENDLLNLYLVNMYYKELGRLTVRRGAMESIRLHLEPSTDCYLKIARSHGYTGNYAFSITPDVPAAYTLTYNANGGIGAPAS